MITALLLLGMTAPASASDWALEEWLAEPDVKLVAVEFYADWCIPCKKSAPQWEALRKKYAPQGLKLVVVNLGEKPGGGAHCTRLPWNPDESLCEPALAKRLGVTTLPEAFVWSWQGNLLVDRGQHVDQIEQVIRRYLDDNPRVQVMATGPKGRPDTNLQRLLEAEIGEAGKLVVVADAKMRQRLAKLRKASHRASGRDDQRCALGAEVSANSLLNVERFPGSVSLSLVDAVTGCQRATANVKWEATRPAKSVRKGVFKLMAQIKRRRVEMPGGGTKPTRRSSGSQVTVRVMPEDEDEWVAEEDATIAIKFDSEPAGAEVTLDGDVVCKATPCRREVPAGRHTVAMTKDEYSPRERAVTLEAGQNVSWTLQATFGTLTVRSTPSGVGVTIDGEPRGKTPLEGLKLAAGEHTVVLEDRCHRRVARELTLPRGKIHTLELPVTTKRAGLKVSAVDASGDVLEADVFVDGEKLGRTPKTFTVAVCAQALEVRHELLGNWRSRLALEEKTTTTVTATARAASPAGKLFMANAVFDAEDLSTLLSVLRASLEDSRGEKWLEPWRDAAVDAISSLHGMHLAGTLHWQAPQKTIPRTKLSEQETRLVNELDTLAKQTRTVMSDPRWTQAPTGSSRSTKLPRSAGMVQALPNLTVVSALLFFRHGQFAEAVKRVIAVFDLYPQHPAARKALLLIVRAYVMLKHFDKVEGWARKLIQARNFKTMTRPELQQLIAVAQHGFAQDLVERRRYDDAIRALERLVDEFMRAHAEIAAEALVEIAHIRELQGDLAKAKAVYKAVIKRFKKTSAATRAREALKELKRR